MRLAAGGSPPGGEPCRGGRARPRKRKGSRGRLNRRPAPRASLADIATTANVSSRTGDNGGRRVYPGRPAPRSRVSALRRGVRPKPPYTATRHIARREAFLYSRGPLGLLIQVYCAGRKSQMDRRTCIGPGPCAALRWPRKGTRPKGVLRLLLAFPDGAVDPRADVLDGLTAQGLQAHAHHLGTQRFFVQFRAVHRAFQRDTDLLVR